MYHKKSVTLAVFMVILLGPLGLFYGSTLGGLIMCILPIFFFLEGWGDYLLYYCFAMYPVSVIWAVIDVRLYNSSMEREFLSQNSIPKFKSDKSNFLPQDQDQVNWIRNNPGRSINDYYVYKKRKAL